MSRDELAKRLWLARHADAIDAAGVCPTCGADCDGECENYSDHGSIDASAWLAANEVAK